MVSSTPHTGSTCIQQNDIIPDGTLLSTTPIYAPTFAACCNACASAARCNVFAFCPVGAGNCTIPPGSVGAGTYNETACMLMYQQSLEIPGNGIKAATYSTNVVINFVAGAPIVATAANVSVDGYRVYAYAHMPNAVGTLRTCGAAANATCQLSGVSQEVHSKHNWWCGSCVYIHTSLFEMYCGECCSLDTRQHR